MAVWGFPEKSKSGASSKEGSSKKFCGSLGVEQRLMEHREMGTGFRRNIGDKCVCVCVCVFSSHLFWTSSSLDVPAGVAQEEGHTGFIIRFPSAVNFFIFLARKIQPFVFVVDREVEFCVLTI